MKTMIRASVEDKADKSKLADVIAKAEALKEADYTADSWKPVAEALAAAKAVNADEKATQAQVDEAMNTLTNVMSALVKAGRQERRRRAEGLHARYLRRSDHHVCGCDESELPD